jgi:hypothetical protein
MGCASRNLIRGHGRPQTRGGASLRATPVSLPATQTPPALRWLAAGDRGTAREAWLALEAAAGGAPGLAASWDWTEAWLEAFADVVPHRFALATAAGSDAPLGIALVAEPRTRRPPVLGARTSYLGTAGEPWRESVFVERNRLMCAPADRGAFAGALLGELARDRRWDRLAFNGAVPEDVEALRAAGATVGTRVELCPVADLTAAKDGDVTTILSKSRRQRARQSRRAFGETVGTWAQDGAEAQAILGELIDLHQASWAARGERGSFSSERFTAFHRGLVERLAPRDGAVLFRLQRAESGETIGCLYGLREGGRLLFYQSGLRSYSDNKLRAGLVCHVACMDACLARGYDTYDFLAPVTQYKEALSTRNDEIVWAHVERPRVRAKLHPLLRKARRRMLRLDR